MVKCSLFPHLPALSLKTKIAVGAAIFLALILGEWMILKIPPGDFQKPTQADTVLDEDDLFPSPGFKLLRWEQLQINKIFSRRPHERFLAQTEPEQNPEPAKADNNRREAPGASSQQVASRGERMGAVIKGYASWYGGGDGFDGLPTASGELFDAYAFTAAHRELPFGTMLRVTSPGTGKSVVVRINDRGPFNYNLILDLSWAAAEQIGIISAGVGPVEIEILE